MWENWHIYWKKNLISFILQHYILAKEDHPPTTRSTLDFLNTRKSYDLKTMRVITFKFLLYCDFCYHDETGHRFLMGFRLPCSHDVFAVFVKYWPFVNGLPIWRWVPSRWWMISGWWWWSFVVGVGVDSSQFSFGEREVLIETIARRRESSLLINRC